MEGVRAGLTDYYFLRALIFTGPKNYLYTVRDHITISQCFFQLELIKIAQTPIPSAILIEKTKSHGKRITVKSLIHHENQKWINQEFPASELKLTQTSKLNLGVLNIEIMGKCAFRKLQRLVKRNV